MSLSDTPSGVHRRTQRLTYRRVVDSLAGIVVVAVVVLWLAYMVPQRLRHRQQLLESRVDDRFSGRLRILAVAKARSQPRAGGGGRQSSLSLHSHGDCTTSSSADVSLLTPPHGMQVRPRRNLTDGEQDMERQDHHASSPPLDALHTRRAAAAKRRALLSISLLIVTVGVAVTSAVTVIPWWTAAIPGILLMTVLILGRRAVMAGARADAMRTTQSSPVDHAHAAPVRHYVPALKRPGRPAPAVRPAVTGRAVRPSQSHTQMISRVSSPARSATAATSAPEDVIVADVPPQEVLAEVVEKAPDVTPLPVRPEVTPIQRTTTTPAESAPAEGGEWQPVAVPRPVYVTKASAPRWEPAPLTAELRQLTEARLTALANAFGEVAAPYQPTHEVPDDSLGVNLNSVLARRRVAGE